jgi:hypothetical protein
MTDAIYDCEGLKVLAKDLGRPIETLVAQSKAILFMRAAQVGALTRRCLPPCGSDSTSSGGSAPPGDEPDEHHDPLFDSTRDYVERMDRYKEYQGKPITHSATTTRRRRKANGEGAS